MFDIRKINELNPAIIRFVIVTASALLFIPFLGGVHLFDWDEINFAEAAREMIVTNDFLTVKINFQPFWEKPPLFIWMQAFSMKLFGINEFAARFPNAICGIATLLTLFNVGRYLKNNIFGILWASAFAGAVMPFFYFKSGIIDPWFNLFIFLGIWYLIRYSNPENEKRTKVVFLAALFSGLAVLTKGPVGILIIILAFLVFLVSDKFRMKLKLSELMFYFLVFAFTGGLWFILQMLNGHFDMVKEFIIYQVRLFTTKDAGHGGFPGYHFVVLFFTVFPTSVMALKSFGKLNTEDLLFRHTRKWMIILLWVVLILFTIVKTKIIHYSSLAYFPLSFLASVFVYMASQGKAKWSKTLSVMLIFVATVIAIPAISLQFIDAFKNEIISLNLIHDVFAIENLKASVNWTGFEFLYGLIFLFTVISVLYFVQKEKVMKRVLLLWTVTLLFTYSALITLVPKIEKYSQNAMIEYFKSFDGKDVYLKNIYFKSYATYFYGNTKPPTNPEFYNENWLLTGNIDKDVFFITKIHRSENLKSYPEIKKTGEKNGFVFYRREAKHEK